MLNEEAHWANIVREYYIIVNQPVTQQMEKTFVFNDQQIEALVHLLERPETHCASRCSVAANFRSNNIPELRRRLSSIFVHSSLTDGGCSVCVVNQNMQTRTPEPEPLPKVEWTQEDLRRMAVMMMASKYNTSSMLDLNWIWVMLVFTEGPLDDVTTASIKKTIAEQYNIYVKSLAVRMELQKLSNERCLKELEYNARNKQ